MFNYEACGEGIKEGLIEVAKLIPGLGTLIEGVRAYQNKIEELQREEFIKAFDDRLKKREGRFSRDWDWYKTDEARQVIKKIIASALNAEYADKIDYFANAIFNVANDYEPVERLKFIEILRNISKPALIVLKAEKRLQDRRGPHHSPQVLNEQIIKETGLNPYLVDACVNELYALGVFSSTISYTSDGTKSESFSDGVVAYTDFSEKFVSFIEDPPSFGGSFR